MFKNKNVLKTKQVFFFTFSIVSFMVMSIISACFCLPFLIIPSMDVGLNRNSYRYSSNDNRSSGVFGKVVTYTVVLEFFFTMKL